MRRNRATALAAAAALAFTVPMVTSRASEPQSQTTTVPSTAGQTVTLEWTGTIPPGVNPTSQCDGSTPEDTHDIAISVPNGVYQTLTAQFSFSITWAPTSGDSGTNDEIVTVTGPMGEIGSADTGATTETVNASDLAGGKYVVHACGFVNATPQPYKGKLVIKTEGNEQNLASAPANGLGFTASVAADPQRDEAEPLIETAPDGRTYTCGPTGFGSAADYAQVSTDGGDQFHLLGTPPRGQQSIGGGGDCAINLAPDKNPDGNYQYAYTGLGPLTGFATSTSPDNGHTLASAGPQGNGLQNTGVLADRQWNVFLDDHTVLLSYNQQQPRNIVVQRSEDGGLTYGPQTAVGGANPDFPGPMRTLPASFNKNGPQAGRVVYFGWNKGTNVNLSVSHDGGRTFTDCVAATDPGVPRAGFVTADNDSAGNIYLAYAEKAKFHTYMVVLPAANLRNCNQPIETPNGRVAPKNDPATVGFTAPVQVDRDNVRTTVFPWLAAGGAPGRVAVTFYGTETEGDPNTGAFKASWNVYVNQSLNALSPARTFSQVKATTHPMHYDSICLNGLGCSLSNPPGDRSLADFFAIKQNPVSGRLQVVYNNDAKRPGEAAGHVASPMVFTQNTGPSNNGTTLTRIRPVVRSSSVDPKGDALSDYSNLFFPPATTNQPAADFVSMNIGPLAGGGFTLNMKLASLSDADLAKALSETNSQSLLWTLRFSNGFQPFAVTARFSPSTGWKFKINNYNSLVSDCFAAPSPNDDKCLAFGNTGVNLAGSVNQATGTITVKVPVTRPGGSTQLFALKGGQGDGQRPHQVTAFSGSRFYDASVFSFGSVTDKETDVRETQTYLYPLDNTPAMDFLLP